MLSYPLIAELNPLALTSTAISVDSITIMLSGAIFQPLFGWIMSLHAVPPVQGSTFPEYSSADFMLAMWIMPAAFLLSIAITWVLKESFCKAQS